MQFIAVAVGGAIGSLLRFMMSEAVYRLLARDFPYGTLAVNILGSFLIGFLFVLLAQKWPVSTEWRLAVFVGLIGGFTTFSTFSLETVALLESGAFLRAFFNIMLSVMVCLLATWLGLGLARQL